MTKTKKTIMWATIACLLVVGVAGGAVGVTYSRYASSGTGTGSATIAYWDVAVTPTDSTSVSVYASPSADAYSSETYTSEAARSTKSDLLTAATLTNSGDVAATVEVSVTGDLGYTLREGVDSTTESENISKYLSAESLAAHFQVELFQSTTENDSNPNELGGEVTLPAATTTGSERTNSYLYIYCDLVWTSDTDDSCYGTEADAFDTWIGTNVESINFTLSYSAVQAVTSSEEP